MLFEVCCDSKVNVCDGLCELRGMLGGEVAQALYVMLEAFDGG